MVQGSLGFRVFGGGCLSWDLQWVFVLVCFGAPSVVFKPGATGVVNFVFMGLGFRV